jgi:tRNA-modifying protein YgfZ
MTGKDARQFLHNFCTNDINRIGNGEGCEAFVTNIKGRILAHIFVFVNEDSVWIETNRFVEDALLAHLDRYLINADVQLHSRTDQFGELLVTGPQCADMLSSLNIQANRLGLFEHAPSPREGARLMLRRVDLLGQPGFFLMVDRQGLLKLWQELAASGIRPGGAAAFHACRIESGLPLVGLDLTDDNLVQEAARTQRAISFTKGCYLGQEPIARIDAVGHLNRALRILKLDSALAPEAGAAIRSENGTEIGTVTSSAPVPGAERSVALGCVRSGHAKAETVVIIRVNDEEIPATVCWHEQL